MENFLDESCRCCNCAWFDDMESVCRLNPPAYAGHGFDEYGDQMKVFRQPLIEFEWSEWCSFWKPADQNQTREDRLREIVQLINEYRAEECS